MVLSYLNRQNLLNGENKLLKLSVIRYTYSNWTHSIYNFYNIRQGNSNTKKGNFAFWIWNIWKWLRNRVSQSFHLNTHTQLLVLRDGGDIKFVGYPDRKKIFYQIDKEIFLFKISQKKWSIYSIKWRNYHPSLPIATRDMRCDKFRFLSAKWSTKNHFVSLSFCKSYPIFFCGGP